MFWWFYDGQWQPKNLVYSLHTHSFNQLKREISFNVTGDGETIGFCNITLPNTLIQNLWQDNFAILVDGQPPKYISVSNDKTYTYIYITYAHSEHEVTIIQELSPLAIPPLIIAATLLIATLNKRKCRRKAF